MSLKIGRAGIAVTLDDPETWQDDGYRVSLTGLARASTAYDNLTLHQQLSGLANNLDEPFVPVLWTEAPDRLDGWYFVDSVSLGSTPVSLTDGAGGFPWSITLVRPRNHAVGTIEYYVTSMLRSGATTRGVATGYLDVGLFHYLASPTAPDHNDEGADGVSSVHLYPVTDYLEQSLIVATPMEQWYTNAATVEESRDNGTTWRPAVGREVHDVVNANRAIRLSNGLIRITHISGPAVLGIEAWLPNQNAWGGSAVNTAKNFQVLVEDTADGSAAPNDWAHCEVTRNDPMCCAIRFTSVDTGIVTDVVLRRGARMAEIVVTLPGYLSAGKQIGIAKYSSNESTATTSGGAYPSSATTIGADTTRWVIATPVSVTVDSTVGGFTSDADRTQLAMGLGMVVNSGSGTNHTDVTGLVARFMAATTVEARLLNLPV